MTDLSSFPNTTADEAIRDTYAESVQCPYFYNAGPYRALDQCMNPSACECWTFIQRLREEENTQ